MTIDIEYINKRKELCIWFAQQLEKVLIEEENITNAANHNT